MVVMEAEMVGSDRGGRDGRGGCSSGGDDISRGGSKVAMILNDSSSVSTIYVFQQCFFHHP